MSGNDVVRSGWFKSSLSGGSGCVEIRFDGDWVHVRDSKQPEQARLRFTKREWAAFTGGVRLGEFDPTE